MRTMANGARSRSIGSKWSDRDDSRCGTRRSFCTAGCSPLVSPLAVAARGRFGGGFGSDVVAVRDENCGLGDGGAAGAAAWLVDAARAARPSAAAAAALPAELVDASPGTRPTGAGGCDELRLCLVRLWSPVDEVRFERDRRRAGKPYPVRSPALGEGGSSAAGDVAGLRCADDVVQPRGRRWMNPPRARPKRLPPPPGEPGVVAPCATPGEGRGRAELDGERANEGCEVLTDEGAGGVPAGLALLDDEADAVDDWRWRGIMSTADGVGGAISSG